MRTNRTFAELAIGEEASITRVVTRTISSSLHTLAATSIRRTYAVLLPFAMTRQRRRQCGSARCFRRCSATYCRVLARYMWRRRCVSIRGPMSAMH